MSHQSKTSSAGNLRSKDPQTGIAVAFWIVTGLFCLEMLFTAWYELRVLPDAAQAFARLGFSSNAFRIELSWAKVAGVLALLIPKVPARWKEWAYAGFAINLISALIAHASIADRPAAFVASSLSLIFWSISYFCFRRMQASASAKIELTQPLQALPAHSV